MIVTLTHPITNRPRAITQAVIHMPGPDVDLVRPPAHLSRLKWHISNISDVPVDAVDLLDESDLERILDGYDAVLANFRATARAIGGGSRNERRLARKRGR